MRSAPVGKHCDGGGLWLIRRADGGAQWMLRCTLHGQRREMGLGRLADIPLREARAQAERWRGVVAGGMDPVKERERQRREAARGRPGPDMPVDARPGPASETAGAIDAPMPAPVQTQANPPEPVRRLEVTSLGDDFLKDQITQKDVQIGELNDQLKRRDEQIMTLLERDRETNLLINGLQQTLLKTLGLEEPRSTRRDQGGGAADGGIDRSDV